MVSQWESGQVTLFGKGAKTRAVVVSKATWQALQSLRGRDGTTKQCSVARRGAHSFLRRCGALCVRPPSVPGFLAMSHRIGFGIVMPAMR